ncbi:MAG TPA: hypothetical protein VHL85_13445 [Burkholderiales bacterium]|jgi:hypothetical protein|nr:hypothetical protein [Burkholderiales bacterium]
MNAMYERYRADAAFREALVAQAHRQRTAAIGELIAGAVRTLLARQPLRGSRMLHRSGAL